MSKNAERWRGMCEINMQFIKKKKFIIGVKSDFESSTIFGCGLNFKGKHHTLTHTRARTVFVSMCKKELVKI